MIQTLDVNAEAAGPDGQDDLLTVALSDYELHVDVSQALIFVAMGVNLMRRNSSHVIFQTDSQSQSATRAILKAFNNVQFRNQTDSPKIDT